MVDGGDLRRLRPPAQHRRDEVVAGCEGEFGEYSEDLYPVRVEAGLFYRFAQRGGDEVRIGRFAPSAGEGHLARMR